MAEPVSTTATVAVSFGLTALLTGWVGEVGAEVMMVILSAIAGSITSLSSKKKTLVESFKFVFLGVLLATVLAWAISSMLTNQYPTLASPYLPTIVAFMLGFTVDKFPIIMEKVSEKIMNKVQ